MRCLSIICCVVATLTLSAQQSVHFEVKVAEETQNEKVYDFIVDDFDHLTSLQYSILFDQSKMQFTGIRNVVISDLTMNNFNVVEPGILLSVWVDLDLIPNDLPNPVAIFQLVFELSEPGGSTLCFSSEPLDYEVARDVSTVLELIVEDDCNEGLALNLNETSINEPAINTAVRDFYLSKSGQLDFTTSKEVTLGFSLFDFNGQEIITSSKQIYPTGRQSLQFGKALLHGVYVLKINSAGQKGISTSVYAK